MIIMAFNMYEFPSMSANVPYFFIMLKVYHLTTNRSWTIIKALKVPYDVLLQEIHDTCTILPVLHVFAIRII